MPREASITCVADVAATLGEGPVWLAQEQALYWVDIKGRRTFRLGGDGAVTVWANPMHVGSLTPRRAGGFIAGTDQGLATVDADFSAFTVVTNPEPDRPDNRFNDAKTDRAGRLWAGTMDNLEKRSCGTLYRVDAKLRCTAVDDGYSVTNGPAFSIDGQTMYHNDSGRQITYAFDLDDDGNASNRRVFARFGEGEGYPDGMTVDSADCLWIAFWDGWCLRRFSSGGECIDTVRLPVQRPTSCAFGGPALDRLYVTSASVGLDEAALAAQPCAGGLLMLDPQVSGPPEMAFQD